MSLDLNPELFVAAFPYQDGRVLYVMRDTLHCPTCARDVKLVIRAVPGLPLECVPCAETKRLALTTSNQEKKS